MSSLPLPQDQWLTSLLSWLQIQEHILNIWIDGTSRSRIGMLLIRPANKFGRAVLIPVWLGCQGDTGYLFHHDLFQRLDCLLLYIWIGGGSVLVQQLMSGGVHPAFVVGGS